MTTENQRLLGRREFLIGGGATLGVAISSVVGLGWKGGLGEQAIVYQLPHEVTSSGITLAPTPACLDADDIAETMSTIEGPFYSPATPLKTNFREPGFTGDPVRLVGRVLDTNCNPIPNAVLDFWHVDETAIYDNVGYRYRGHQFTDSDGIYELETIHTIPYTLQGVFRTAHLHVKVQGPNTDLLTTQLFFSREAENNAIDGGYLPELEVEEIGVEGGIIQQIYNFVLPTKA